MKLDEIPLLQATDFTRLPIGRHGRPGDGEGGSLPAEGKQETCDLSEQGWDGGEAAALRTRSGRLHVDRTTTTL